jgi:hypothetical protein
MKVLHDSRHLHLAVQFNGWKDQRLGFGGLKMYRLNLWVAVGPWIVVANIG